MRIGDCSSDVCSSDLDAFSITAMANDALVQPESRAAFRRLIYQGWIDALRQIHPLDDKLYTFWDYQAGCWPRNAGLRIDHFLLSPQAADRLADAQVDRGARAKEKSSDHTPAWVRLRSEERRVGTGCGRMCRVRGGAYN